MTEREPTDPLNLHYFGREVASDRVGIPEFMRKEMIEGIVPGNILYFRPNVLTFDIASQSMWLNIHTRVKEENVLLRKSMTTKESHIALMPILSDTATEYIVDASGLKTDQFDIYDDWLGYEEERNSGTVHEQIQLRRASQRAVAAAVFMNLEGIIELHGRKELFSTVRSLVATHDTQLAENDTKPGVPHPSHRV